MSQRFEKFVAPLLATGDNSPETRKRKAHEILIATSKKARADLKDYKFSKVELEDVVQDRLQKEARHAENCLTGGLDG